MPPDEQTWVKRLLQGLSEHEQEYGSPAFPLAKRAGDVQARDTRPEVPEIPRYEIQERLGEGATAVVFRARDKALNRGVAIKLLRETAAWNEQTRQRFRREAEAAAGLAHPNVVTVYDVGEVRGQLYLVMELVEGKALSEVLKGSSGRGEQQVVGIIEKAARGVGAAHQRGIVHRDLKPANILISASGEPKVGDFGLAHLVDSGMELTKPGAVLGTPLYMAPEQVEGRSKEVTPRTDVYGLGAVLYEALVGRPPHEGETIQELYGKIAREEPVAPRKLNGKVSRELETILLKALEREPGRRYATADEFAEELKRWRTGEAILARPPSVFYRSRKLLARHKAWAASLGAGILVALAVLAITIPAIVRGRQREERTRRAIGLWGKISPLLAEGEKLLEAGDTEGAGRKLDAAVALCRDSLENEDLPHAHHLLGRLLEARGKSEAGKQELALASRMGFRSDTSSFDLELTSRLSPWPRSVEAALDPDVSRYRARPERVWVASPEGGEEADGTPERPLSLARAVGTKSPARPGDHVLLRGGTYRIPRRGLEIPLAGTRDRPIMIRRWGVEEPILDLADLDPSRRGFSITGNDLWIVGLEFTDSSSVRTGLAALQTLGVHCSGARVKLVNCYFHDLRLCAVDVEGRASDSELYGNIFLNNGLPGEKNPVSYGYNVVMALKGGTKDLTDNVLAHMRSGGSLASLRGNPADDAVLRISGNIVYGPGVFLVELTRGMKSHVAYCENVHQRSRLSIRTADSSGSSTVKVSGNFIMWGSIKADSWGVGSVFKQNTLWSPDSLGVEVNRAERPEWESNTYYAPFGGSWDTSGRMTWKEWKKHTLVDQSSRLVERGPSGVHVILRPNKFERGRAHVALYNWAHRDAADLDLSSLLKPGDRFGIYRLEDLKGSPAVSGAFEGHVRLPLQPDQEFQVFVIRLLPHS